MISKRIKFRIEGTFDGYWAEDGAEKFASYRPRDLLDLAEDDQYQITVEVTDEDLT